MFGVIGFVLEKIILLIVLLSPAAPKIARESAAMNFGFEPAETVTEAGGGIPFWVLMLLLAAGFLALVLWILYKLRHVRLKRRQIPAALRKTVRKNLFWKAVRDLIRKGAQQLRFELEYSRSAARSRYEKYGICKRENVNKL
ncbi:MAG: hypothetical protein ACI4F3_01370 [Enterocloster sp.]